jgi:adenylyltransferase/sulfurtransferase
MADIAVPTHADRYARQRPIRGWQQERLAAATVLVAGAGALGNEVAKNLALLGVGHLLIVDMDHIEPSNLSRTVLFEAADVGQPKATTAARALKRLNPEMQVTALPGDLRFVLGLGRLHACTLALGCLDNQGARSFLSRMCLAAQVPLLDAGMWALGGEIRTFLTSDGPCFHCLLAPDERADLWLRYSCTGGFQPAEADAPAPTTITTTAIVAGLMTQYAVQILQGEHVENGVGLVYTGQTPRLYRTAFQRDPACPHHTPLDWSAVQPYTGTTATVTVRAILSHVQEQSGHASPVLDLGRDLLIAFVCPTCQATEQVMYPQGLVDAARARCPTCGTTRQARTTSTVTWDDPWLDAPLAQLGVPESDVLRLHVGDHVILYELVQPDTD